MQNNCLIIIENDHCTQISLEGGKTYSLGREAGSDCSIVLASKLASRNHAELLQSNGIWFYCDQSNTNGTKYRGSKLKKGLGGRYHPIMLNHGDVLQIGEDNAAGRVLMLFVNRPLRGINYYPLPAVRPVSIGRSKECSISFPYDDVLPCQAWIWNNGNSYLLQDMGGAKGTLLNGQTVPETVAVKFFDKISIGSHRLIFTGDGLLLYQI